MFKSLKKDKKKLILGLIQALWAQILGAKTFSQNRQLDIVLKYYQMHYKTLVNQT